MAYEYTALIRKGDDSDFWIDCPDLPGCVASGKTIEEAKKQFADATHFHLVGIKDQERGYSLPVLRSREDVLADKEEGEYLDAYAVIVDEPLTVFDNPGFSAHGHRGAAAVWFR